MACNQTLAGLLRDCLPSMGGIRRLYLANFEDIAGVTESGKITAINLATGVTTPFFRYEVNDETASMESTPTIDRASGANYVETVLAATFPHMDTTKRAEVEAIKLNDLVAIVEDNNGHYWYLGKDRPVKAGGSPASGTGTAFGDANRYAIELHDVSLNYPFEVNVGTGAGAVELDTLVAN